MTCRNTVAVLTAATAISLGGLTLAADEPGSVPNPARSPMQQGHKPDTGSVPAPANADQSNRTDRTSGDRTADAAMGADRSADQIRKLVNDPMAGDKLFAMAAAEGNQWEIAFNNLVAERAQTREIKDSARMIAQDHQQAQQKLEPIAQKNGVMLEQSLSPEKQAKLEVFRAMPVDKLETCWITDMRADHAKDVICFADHTKTLQNADLKTYASETLPKLRQHAADVNRIAASKGFTNDAPAGGAGDKMPTMQQ